MKKIIILAFSLMFPMLSISQEKTFIREYLYKASETDSKVSSRQKALTEVKKLLIEELGTYVESYVNYEVTEENNKITKDFFTNEIKTLSVGTTETKIIEENWDGYEYFVKAEIVADPDEVLKRINQTLSKRKSNEVIDSLKVLIVSSNKELDLKNKELDLFKSQLAAQQKQIDSKENTLKTLNKQLSTAKQQLENYQAQEKQILNEIEAIERKIKNATTKAVSNVRIGMTPSEVRQVCGNPRSIDDCYELNYNYGSVWVLFEAGIVKLLVDARDFSSCGDIIYHSRRAKIIKY